ncbi:MAG: hypothetical protein M1839_008868 [Geoglossum umbratile]|nr:MAG: hypothetical protein M1839_008868 [Geoglossum umbratile]
MVEKQIELHNLSKEVVEKAQGVFLWVKLVVDELLECLQYIQRGGAGDVLSGCLDNISKGNGHVLLVQYCIDAVCRDLDIRIPDVHFRALNAEKTTRRSHTRDIDRLVDTKPNDAFRNLTNLFMELDIPKPLVGGFVKLRGGVEQPSIWLLLMAIYRNLFCYLKEKLPPKIQLDEGHEGRLIATAIAVATYMTLPGEQVITPAVLIFLLGRKLTADCICAGKIAYCYAFEKGDERERRSLLDLLATPLTMKDNQRPPGRTAAATIAKLKYFDASGLLMGVTQNTPTDP